jgi:flagellar basal-body rod protein FlgB
MDFGPIIDGVAHSLDLFVRRHGVISQNLAHLDTPGYRAHDLEFQQALEAAFQRRPPERPANPRHLPVGSALERGEVVEDPHAVAGRDGNTVDLDRETARLAQNGIRYETGVRLVERKLALLKYAVTEGGTR